MKSIIILLNLLLFLACSSLGYSAEPLELSLADLADQISRELSEGQKHKIAIVEFSNIDGRTMELGQFISEELITRLFRTKKFEVVERQLLSKVVEEHQLNLSGLIDEKTAKKLGRVLGVDAICAGTITDLGDSVKINARLITTESGAIFAVAAAEISKDEKVRKLLGKVKAPRPEPVEKDRSKVSRKVTKGNLLNNGGFTKRYESWERQVGDITKGSSKTEVIAFPNAKSGKALHIKHQGNGSIQFSQVVDVPTADLTFSASFQASSHEGMIIGFTGTGVVQIALQYIGEDDSILGQTVLLNHVKNPFADTPLIGVPRTKSDSYKSRYLGISSGKFYKDYAIDIRKEIEDNLLGIDPDALCKIAVIIWCGATHHQAGSELWITDIGIKSKF